MAIQTAVTGTGTRAASIASSNPAARVPVPVTAVWIATTAWRPGNRFDKGSAQSGRLASGTATPPMISMGRKMHWPSACTAGTLPTRLPINAPMHRKHRLATISASMVDTGWGSAGMPRARAATCCRMSAPASSTARASTSASTKRQRGAGVRA